MILCFCKNSPCFFPPPLLLTASSGHLASLEDHLHSALLAKASYHSILQAWFFHQWCTYIQYTRLHAPLTHRALFGILSLPCLMCCAKLNSTRLSLKSLRNVWRHIHHYCFNSQKGSLFFVFLSSEAVYICLTGQL